ncbi:type II toxin-antitoxin system VapC family toxin [Frankia sp. CiP1_Cm_nod2]|uniref:type II toxin-antitoxin system VapC family toxin n=1 Tax=Frankia sp. CiP1_Cm_nod2 TaxID=2897161 RepID=UPI002024BEC7
MGAVVLDTSVILALFDPQDALHACSAQAARRRRDAGDVFLLPATVLAELLVGAARRSEEEVATRRRLTTAAFGPPYPVDEAVAVAAALRRARHQSLRLPDALVLATADVVDADTILTGDRRWKGLDSRVEVVQ